MHDINYIITIYKFTHAYLRSNGPKTHPQQNTGGGGGELEKSGGGVMRGGGGGEMISSSHIDYDNDGGE